MPFSQDHGYGHPAEVKPENRTKMSSTMLDLVLSSAERWGVASFALGAVSPAALRDIVWRILKSDIGNKEHELKWNFRLALEGAPWFSIYDFIEALYTEFAKNDSIAAGLPLLLSSDEPFPKAPGFEKDVNDCLLQEGIPWHLLDGKIVSRGDEAFENTVKTAAGVLERDDKPTAAGHLRFAIAALSARPKANTSGAVAHATSAVECVLGKFTGEAMTLGKYLDKHPNLFHPALKKGIDGVYGYASDEGARHGKEGTEPTAEEAEFAIAVCAAVCTLLTRKHSK